VVNKAVYTCKEFHDNKQRSLRVLNIETFLIWGRFLICYYSDAHEASLHHQMDENGKDLFSGQVFRIQ